MIDVWLAKLFGRPAIINNDHGWKELPDKDIGDLLVTPSSTPWKRVDTCTECHALIGHDEWMTDICLTCGQTMDYMKCYNKSQAMRSIVRHGKWVRQQNTKPPLLELAKGKWVTVEEYDNEYKHSP